MGSASVQPSLQLVRIDRPAATTVFAICEGREYADKSVITPFLERSFIQNLRTVAEAGRDVLRES
jgi:hypothetical protein